MLRRTVQLSAITTLCIALLTIGAVGSAAAQSEDEVASSPECGCTRKPPAVVVGDWSGTIDDGQGTLILSLSQHYRQLSGNWSATLSDGQNVGGTITGKVGAKGINVKLHTADRHCRYHVIGKFDSGTLQGTLASSKRCPDETVSTFNIQQQ
jgi:hypothetical protein